MLELQTETPRKFRLEVVGVNWVVEEIDPEDPEGDALAVLAAGRGKRVLKVPVQGYMALRVQGEGPVSIAVQKPQEHVKLARKPSWSVPRMPENYESAALRHQKMLFQEQQLKLQKQMAAFAAMQAKAAAEVASGAEQQAEGIDNTEAPEQ